MDVAPQRVPHRIDEMQRLVNLDVRVFINAPDGPTRHGVDNGLRAGVQCSTKMNTGARATGLRGRLPCRRPDEPDLGNTSVGRR